jgi:hypothetical protein
VTIGGGAKIAGHIVYIDELIEENDLAYYNNMESTSWEQKLVKRSPNQNMET